MRNSKLFIVLSAMFVIFWLAPVQAEEENDSIARLVQITAVDGKEKELLDAISDYHHWIADKEGHWKYYWFATVTGPHTGTFIARSGDHNWSDFDAEYDWQEEAGANFRTNVAPLIADSKVTITREMGELSHWPESMDGYTHFTVEHWYINNGAYGRFRQGFKKIHELLSAANYGTYYSLHSVESGGKGGQVSLVTPRKGWSDMADRDPSFFDIVSEALGGPEEFEAFMSDWGSTFRSGHSFILRYLPEASDYGEDD